MPGFLSPRRGLPLLLIPEYLGSNKEQRIPDRSKTVHRNRELFLDSSPYFIIFVKKKKKKVLTK